MKWLFAAATMLTTVSCMAQDAPAAVKTAFAKNFPGITVKQWDKEEDGYEANFIKEGKSMSATFTANGTLKETEMDIKVSALPGSVAEYIKTNYTGATIKEAAIITKPTGETMYEAEVKGKDLLFDKQGKFLKEEED